MSATLLRDWDCRMTRAYTNWFGSAWERGNRLHWRPAICQPRNSTVLLRACLRGGRYSPFWRATTGFNLPMRMKKWTLPLPMLRRRIICRFRADILWSGFVRQFIRPRGKQRYMCWGSIDRTGIPYPYEDFAKIEDLGSEDLVSKDPRPRSQTLVKN